ncbi:hypothetical protein C4K23_5987 [Pseudomonas chlororaphis]|nr:hypothetical protein C4K38_6412 [Pseudomonas chlororaphis subsp. piscium]AZD32692.1 hypothetical protein C4K23_5987 [Pseudomonas chlororaphis]
MSIPSLFLTQHGLRNAEGAQHAATFRTDPAGCLFQRLKGTSK